MALQGTLDTFALPDVLRLLAATKKTGRLQISGPRGEGWVSVDEGAVGAIAAPHAPHVTEPVDALFELLRVAEGSFTFDSDVAPAPGTVPGELEDLLAQAEALLVEWREIESVVPSMDAWVTLRRSLVAPKVSIDRAHWLTVVSVGSGATVRDMSDDLSLAELPVSRAVRDLVELGLVDIAESAPAAPRGASVAPRRSESSPAAIAPARRDDKGAPTKTATPAEDATPEMDDPTGGDAPAADGAPAPDAGVDAPLPTARPLRARRAKGAAPAIERTEPEVFVPLELPGQGPALSYDPVEPAAEIADAGDPPEMDDLATAFPGLASRAAELAPDDEELARQLATLSPRAAQAVRAAAEATTVEQRDAALAEVELAEAEQGDEQPINRGLLLKFLSSVKS